MRLDPRCFTKGRGAISAAPKEEKRRAVAVIALAAALAVAAALWLHFSHAPNTGQDIYDNEPAFKAYVASLGLAALSFEEARSRLVNRGFRCESLAEGNVSCNRHVRGSNCGELQFVDLKKPGSNGLSHSVTTRFGLTCR